MSTWRRVTWVAGWPVRGALLALIAAYRTVISPMLGERCRFYPSCSAYAREAIATRGALRGSTLAIWRVLRCSPLSAGGVDPVPPPRSGHRRGEGEGGLDDARRRGEYDGVTLRRAS